MNWWFRLQVSVLPATEHGFPSRHLPGTHSSRSAKEFLGGGFSVQSGLADSFLLIPSGNPSIAFLTSWPIFSTALVVEAGLKGLAGGRPWQEEKSR